MSLPTHSQVIIVGAGPTGMVCALTLVGLGVQVTLIDAFGDNRNGSRSVTVHARTLEVLSTIGLTKPLLEAGIQSRGAIVHGSSNKLMNIDLGQLRDDTEFPMVLLIPQREVERVLEAKLAELGIKIFRPHTVVGVKEVPGDGGLEVLLEDGSTIRSRYVVGADGSRSTVRRLANIDFKDPVTGIDYDAKRPQSSTMQITFSDVYFEDPLPSRISRDMISLYLDRFFLLCPLRAVEGTDKNLSFWRITIVALPGTPTPPRQPDITWLQTELDRRFPWGTAPRISSVEFSSRYRIRAAVASTFFKKIGAGNILLVGDVAHVHSPAGGQGLNLGLCDAVALAHAIHANINASSKDYTESDPDIALSTYSTSRHKIALRVIAMTGGFNRLVSGTGWRRIVRNIMLWIVGKLPFMSKRVAWQISGLMNRDA